MNDEDRELLEKTYNLAEENNQILRKMRRSSQWALVWRIFYWVAIIGLSFGAYYLIQPYINMLGGLNGGFKNSLNQTSQIGDLLKGL